MAQPMLKYLSRLIIFGIKVKEVICNVEANNVVEFSSWKPKKKPAPDKIVTKLEREEILERKVFLSLDETCILSATLTKNLRIVEDNPEITEEHFKILLKLLTQASESNHIDDLEFGFTKNEIEHLLMCIETFPSYRNKEYREGPLCIYSSEFNIEDTIDNTISYIYAVFKIIEKQIDDRINRIEGKRDFIEEHLEALSKYIPSFEDEYIKFYENVHHHKKMYEEQYLSKHIVTLEDSILTIDNEDSQNPCQLTRFYIKPLREPYESYNHGVYEADKSFKYLTPEENIRYHQGWRFEIKNNDLNKYCTLEEVEDKTSEIIESVFLQEQYQILTLSDIKEIEQDKIEFLKFIFNRLEALDIRKYNHSESFRSLREYLKRYIC